MTGESIKDCIWCERCIAYHPTGFDCAKYKEEIKPRSIAISILKDYFRSALTQERGSFWDIEDEALIEKLVDALIFASLEAVRLMNTESVEAMLKAVKIPCIQSSKQHKDEN
jgi:ferredoxin